MSVNYSVVFKDGQKVSVSSVCFGRMGVDRWMEQAGSGNNAYRLLERPATEHAFISYDCVKNLHPCWAYDVETSLGSRDWPRATDNQSGSDVTKAAAKKFLHHMKELLNDLPMMKGILSVHPLLGIVRVHTKAHTADQVMMALYLIRNLNQYSNLAISYRFFIKKGYRPRLAAILSHLIATEVGNSNFGREASTVSYNYGIGEYNWINPNTFGKQAFLNMMNQNEEAFTWVQPLWSEAKGYRRDGYFSNAIGGNRNARIFDERYTGRIWDYQNWERFTSQENGNYSNSDLQRNRLKWWHMVDVYSVPGDEPICECHRWNEVDGFGFWFADIHTNRNSHFGGDKLAIIMSQIEAVLTENNIPFRKEEV